MFAIKEMAMLSAKMKGAASLARGLPSFCTPEYIRQGVIEQPDADEDIGKYVLPDGLKDIRYMVAVRHEQETGFTLLVFVAHVFFIPADR